MIIANEKEDLRPVRNLGHGPGVNVSAGARQLGAAGSRLACSKRASSAAFGVKGLLEQLQSSGGAEESSVDQHEGVNVVTI